MMTTRKRTIRKPTAAEKKKLKEAIAEEREGMEANRKVGRALRRKRASAGEALAALAGIREQLGLSLRDIESRSGIAAGNLSKLLNDPDPNITTQTLDRLAAAMGRRVRIEFEEIKSSGTGARDATSGSSL